MNDATKSSSPTTASLHAATHFAAIDYLRIIAAYAIICYHVGAPGANWTFAGLHALTAAAAFFAARSRSKVSDGEIVRRRFERIMIPWFSFSVVHIALAMRDHTFKTWMIWTGGSLHLWFLPFIFLVSCLVAMGARRGLFVQGYIRSAAWAVLAVAMIMLELRYELVGKLIIPIPQFRNAVPAALLGLAIFSFPRTSSLLTRAIALLVFDLIVCALWMKFRVDDTVPFPGTAIGITVFAICLIIPLRESVISSFMGRAAFGVYLMQGLTIRVAFVGLARTPLHSLQTSHENTYSFIVSTVAFLIGLIGVAVLERTPVRRFIA